MKFHRRVLAWLLTVCTLFSLCSTGTFAVFAAETVNTNRETEEDAMREIKANEELLSFQQGETRRFSDDGQIGIPYEITVYYDAATNGVAQPEYMTLGGTPVLMYVVNANIERVGTDSDVRILKSMLERGYIVVVLDYLNHEKAVSPDLDYSAQSLRSQMAAGEYFTDKSIFPEGTYRENLIVPAGYNVTLQQVYFELDKHGTDGTLEEIVTVWNHDFRKYKQDVIVKWVHEDGTRKATQNGFDGSSPVWYSDATGTKVDATNGQYTKIAYTKAESITDCVKADGSPIDLKLYSHVIYPTAPAEAVPVMTMISSAEDLCAGSSRTDRPQLQGFLFRGYAAVVFDYAYVPMARNDHYGYFDGSTVSTGKSETGDNMTYAVHTFNTAQVTTAAMRYVRWLSLSDSETYRFDGNAVGTFGISKAAWMTHLGAPSLRENLYCSENGESDEAIAQLVNDKINAFYQMRYLKGYDGKTRFDNGQTESYTVDGFTVQGGELQPWAVYDGCEIASGAQMIYSCCGGGVDEFCEGYSPLFLTVNLQDTANTQYGQQNIMVNLCRTMNIAALWYEVDIAHTFANGLDVNYGVDTYEAFFLFADYYLKGTAVSVTYTDRQNGSVISASDSITVKFIGEVSADEIQKIVWSDSEGQTIGGTWTSAYGDTEWTFQPDCLSGGVKVTMMIPATLQGKNGVAIGEAYQAEFYTRSEETVDLTDNGTVNVDETVGTTIRVTVPETISADGYALRVLVTNDAANVLCAYNAESGKRIGSVRVSGSGYYEMDMTDALSALTPGTSLSVRLVTQTVAGNVVTYDQNFDTGTGDCSIKYSDYTVGAAIDGAKALKIVRTLNVGEYQADHVFYQNSENAVTLSNRKLINSGKAVTKADTGRRFLIKVRVYDTTSRAVLFYLNNATSKSDRLIDFDRVYMTGRTTANAWNEFIIPYTVYESKYGLTDQIKQLYMQFVPTGSSAMPIYLDALTVEEVFTDVQISQFALVCEQNSDKTVKAPESENAFSVNGVEYASWKAAINAAGTIATVQLQRNYEFTDTDLVNLSGKTDLTIDLNGYRLTASNTKNALLWIAAVQSTATRLTLKNGAVILSDTPLVDYGSSTSKGAGKNVDIQIENVYLTVAEGAQTLNVISAGTITSGVTLNSNITFTDCVIDIQRDHFVQRPVTLFHSGSSDLKVRYTFVGGTWRLDSFRDMTVCTTVISVRADDAGQALKGYFPSAAGILSVSFKQESGDYAVFAATSESLNGYVVCDVSPTANSTPYGAIPPEYEDGEQYPFLLFMDEAFIGGVTSWKNANALAKEYLQTYPQGTVSIVLRADHTVDTYIGNTNWLCFMNGNLVLDLNGHTMISSQSLFEVGVDTTYTGNYDTTFTVKNGTVLVGGGNMCGAQNISNYNKRIDVTFQNVTFGIDRDTFAEKRNALFYGNGDRSQYSGCLSMNLLLKDCTVDLRGIPCNYTVFRFASTTVSVAANISVIGGRILTDANTDHITWYSLDSSNDSLCFEAGEDGETALLSVPHGTVPLISLPTKDGICWYSDLVSSDGETDIYRLVKTGDVPTLSDNEFVKINFENYPVGYKPSFSGSNLSNGGTVFKEANGNQAWRIPFSGTGTTEGNVNINANAYVDIPRISYQTSSTVIIRASYLIPEDGIGSFHARFRKNTCTFVTADGTELPNKTIEWLNLWQIDYNTAGAEAVLKAGGNNQSGSVGVSKGDWLTVEATIDMVNGVYTLSLNGVSVLENITLVPQYSEGGWKTGVGLKNLVIPENSLIIFTPHSSCKNTANSTYVLIDDILVAERNPTTIILDGETIVTAEGIKYQLRKEGKQFLYAVIEYTDGSTRVVTDSTVEIVNGMKITTYQVALKSIPYASFRPLQTSGIRFLTSVDSADWEALLRNDAVESVQIGTLITLYSYWESNGGTFTKEALEKVLRVPANPGNWYSDTQAAGYYVFAGSIVDILPQNYNTLFAGLGYLTVTLKNGETVTVYASYDLLPYASYTTAAKAILKDETVSLNRAQQKLAEEVAERYEADEICRVVCIGDSITKNGYWKNNMYGNLSADRYEVIGLGVNGATGLATGIDQGHPWAYIDQPEYRQSLWYLPDVVVIMLGTNDSKEVNYSQMSQDNGAQYVADMVALIRSYQSLGTDPKIFLALPATVFKETGTIQNTPLEERIIPLLKQAAELTGVELIDVHAATAGAEEHFSDKVHPSDDVGRKMIADAVADAILQYCEQH